MITFLVAVGLACGTTSFMVHGPHLSPLQRMGIAMGSADIKVHNTIK